MYSLLGKQKKNKQKYDKNRYEFIPKSTCYKNLHWV